MNLESVHPIFHVSLLKSVLSLVSIVALESLGIQESLCMK